MKNKSKNPKSKFQIPRCFFLGLGAWGLGLVICTAQEKKDVNKLTLIEKRIEMIAEDNEEENIDFSTLFDDLLLYYENPLDLNFAEREQLQSMMILNEIQINNLLNHIRKNGKLISIYELQSIDGFDLETIRNLLPFVKVSENFDAPKASLKEMFKYSNGEFILRETRVLEPMSGYQPISDSALAKKPNSRYMGSPDLIFSRFRIRYRNNVSIGFITEKDAGELFFRNNLRNNYSDSINKIIDDKHRNGFDFYSAHFFLKGWGNLKHFIIGDYVLQFGQGLTLWSGRAFNKNAFDVIGIKRNPIIIRPLGSAGIFTAGDSFLRGAAATYSILKNVDLTCFYSKNNIDGNLITPPADGSITEEISFTAGGNGGFHRTPKELSSKGIGKVEIFGSHVKYKTKKLELGFTGAQRNYSSQIILLKTRTDNQFSFEGKTNTVFGADYNYLFRNMNFFGEISRSQNGGQSQFHGVVMALDPRLSAVVSYRNYQRNFQPLYSQPFRESYFANEQGIYLGVQSNVTSQITISGYIDKFKFPWLTYYSTAPSGGIDYIGQINYKPNKKMDFYVRYRAKIKDKSYTVPGYATKQLISDTGQTVRIHGSYKITEFIKLQTRLQLVRSDYGSGKQENGYMLFQDVIYDPMSSIAFTFRFALFDTDSYLSRIYAYENDVLYQFNVPAYYDRGSRTYLLIRYKGFRNFDLWLRVSQWYKNNVDSIGSGLDKIEGNTKTELKAQIRYKF